MYYVVPVEPRNYKHFQVKPLTGVLGAEIVGLDLHEPLNSSVWEEIHQAFADHQVLVFQGTELSNTQHENFASGFGEVIQLQLLNSLEGHDNIQVIRRLSSDKGKIIGEKWHADSTYFDIPPKAVVMRAVDIPDFGGDTAFLSMTAAYDALSPAYKEFISSLKVVHSGTRIFGAEYLAQSRRYDAINGKHEQSLEGGDREVIHPLVCTNPSDGRKYLYLNKNYSQRIEGFTNEESAPILNYLYEHSDRYDFTCRIRWKKDQIVVWDNNTTVHKALPDYAGKNRLMTRVTIAGSSPPR